MPPPAFGSSMPFVSTSSILADIEPKRRLQCFAPLESMPNAPSPAHSSASCSVENLARPMFGQRSQDRLALRALRREWVVGETIHPSRAHTLPRRHCGEACPLAATVSRPR